MTELDLPQSALELLSSNNISVVQFLAWNLPPSTLIHPHLTHTENFLSTISLNVNNFDVFAILSPPNDVVKELTHQIQDRSIKSIQWAHIINTGGQQFT
jgi:hypothetical protein